MRDAWEQEYVEYVTARLPALRRLACLLCGDEHRADDIVQDAITKLYVHWDKARAATNVDAYVRMVVVRTFLDEKRLAWSRVRLFATTPDRPNWVDTGADDRTVVRAALSGLPTRQQAVLVLRFLYDLPVAEVSEILGCSEGTVKSQTHHGLVALRQVLGDRSKALAWTE
ncbi:SigE family RNA polymerase sigma factor [Micromonospora sp. CPCC 206061]|uniref:SigE family RNA polymerase sigma factor n=1 Tax=Micromonospora sp. CPCC 206061 TaxID=3122410 RepID=UPI002FF2B231